MIDATGGLEALALAFPVLLVSWRETLSQGVLCCIIMRLYGVLNRRQMNKAEVDWTWRMASPQCIPRYQVKMAERRRLSSPVLGHFALPDAEPPNH